jgi:integrase
MASMFIRPRKGGLRFELRVRHRLLARDVYATFSSREEATKAGQRALADLAEHKEPLWLMKPDANTLPNLRAAIHRYCHAEPIAHNTEKVLATLAVEIGETEFGRIDREWTKAWLRTLKVEKRLAPGTIRKKKCALQGLLDWVVEEYPRVLLANPLKKLKRGFASYARDVREELAKNGHEAPEDGERDRRIEDDEEARIVAEFRRRIDAAATDSERAEYEAMLLMFRLAIETAMRMREIYTLTLDQINVANATIQLKKTKNGDKRAVSLNSKSRALLSEARPFLDALRDGNRLVPFWNGSLEKTYLDRVTSELSQRFAEVFDAAGSVDLRFHDTRHEGACRLVLRAKIALSDSEFAKTTGMRDEKTRQRYLSLRGSEIAAKLG